jgi:GntR family carbon starvation induced transcriptional regulator
MSGSATKTKGAGPPTLSGVIYSTLRQDILQGGLAPAGKLRIEQLCQRYGVTSTPVREALNQLAVEGFVERRDQRGFFVAEVSPTELEQLTDTRCLVEPIALQEAIKHRTVAWEEQVVLSCHRLSRVDRSASSEVYRENPEWEKAHRAFHMALIATCPSRWLVDFCGLLTDHAARYRSLAMSVIYPKRDVPGEHLGLMEAAIHGDVEDVVARLITHYRRTAGIILTAQPSVLAGNGADPATPDRRKRKPR